MVAFGVGSALVAVAATLTALDKGIEPTIGVNALLVAVVAMIVGGVRSYPRRGAGRLRAGRHREPGDLADPLRVAEHDHLHRASPSSSCFAPPASWAGAAHGTASSRVDYVLYVTSLVAVYGVLTVSLNLVVGYTGVLSVAHAAFMGIGAYTTALLLVDWRVNFFLTLPVGLAIAGTVAAALAASTLRLKGDYYIIGSFGFQVIMYSIFLNWIGLTKGPFGIRSIPKPRAFGFRVRRSRPVRHPRSGVPRRVASGWRVGWASRLTARCSGPSARTRWAPPPSARTCDATRCRSSW